MYGGKKWHTNMKNSVFLRAMFIVRSWGHCSLWDSVFLLFSTTQIKSSQAPFKDICGGPWIATGILDGTALYWVTLSWTLWNEVIMRESLFYIFNRWFWRQEEYMIKIFSSILLNINKFYPNAFISNTFVSNWTITSLLRNLHAVVVRQSHKSTISWNLSVFFRKFLLICFFYFWFLFSLLSKC